MLSCSHAFTLSRLTLLHLWLFEDCRRLADGQVNPMVDVGGYVKLPDC